MTTQKKIVVAALTAAAAGLAMAAAQQQQTNKSFEERLKAEGLPVHPQGSIANAVGTPIMLVPDAMSWGPPPPGLPKDLQMAMIEGDPKNANKIYGVRVKFSPGSRIAPHFHPEDERITVISGTFQCGMGEKFDEASSKAYTSGAYMVLPARHPHFAFAKTETVVQINGVGPFGIVYVNPADDPRKAGVGGAGTEEPKK